MSIMEILIRSISGYIFIIPGIILYFGALRKSAKRQILLHITTAFIFCYYLIGILTMTGIGKSHWDFSYRYCIRNMGILAVLHWLVFFCHYLLKLSRCSVEERQI